MNIWTSEELKRIGEAGELQIASLRSDGTLRNYVTIWVVRLGDALYVRSVNGRASGWFRGVHTRHAGRIRAGGLERDVTFVDAGRDLDAQIDAAYAAKYRSSPAAVSHITDSKAQDATIQLVVRAGEGQP